MKKIMITAVTFLLVAGMANAQVATKETAKTSVKPVMTSKTSTTHKTATVSPATKPTPSPSVSQQTTANSTIKRKHHSKKGTTLKKTANK